MKREIATSVAKLTRKFPRLVNVIRSMLPLSLKRKIGSALLPNQTGGIVDAKDGRKFVMIPDRLFLQVLYDGIFEPSLTHFMGSIVQPDDITVDVGSNFGWFATLLATKANQVVCYEPALRIRKILEENIELNELNNITVRPVAIGDEAGEVTFVIEGDAARESALGYVANTKDVSGDNLNQETVPIVRLDDDLAQYANKISLMKVDCEGFEHKAFLGAGGLLSWDNPPVIITEANRETLERSGSTREAMCEELTKYGYQLFGMRSDGTLYPDDGKAPALACVPPKGIYVDRVSTPE